jgi:hypothetical protein
MPKRPFGLKARPITPSPPYGREPLGEIANFIRPSQPQKRADNPLSLGHVHTMSKAEIMAELPKLTKDERYEIRVKIAEMDSDGWLDEADPLTDEEKALLDARLEDMEKHPEKSIPREKARAQLENKFGL